MLAIAGPVAKVTRGHWNWYASCLPRTLYNINVFDPFALALSGALRDANVPLQQAAAMHLAAVAAERSPAAVLSRYSCCHIHIGCHCLVACVCAGLAS